MCDILIRYEDYKFYLRLSNKTFYGYGLYNNKHIPLPKNILNLFLLFKPSNKVLIKDNIYKDLSNNFIYTYNNDELDINKFIYDNSTDALLYLDNKNNSDVRKFKLNKFTIITTTLIMSLLMSSPLNLYNIKDESINDYNLIFSTTYLGEYENLLNNTGYLDFITSIMNESSKKELYNQRLFGFSVRTFDGDKKECKGYYNGMYPNKVYISDKINEGTDEYKSVLVHEFVHLTTISDSDHNLIDEACTEILTNEFFGYDTGCYDDEIILVKKMMETIGTEPILEYLFNNNDELIRKEIKDFLSINEVDDFFESLKLNYDDNKLNKERKNKLEKYLTTIFKIKNGCDSDFAFSLVEGSNPMYKLNKNYFKPDSDNYILTSKSEEITRAEAIELGYILPAIITTKDNYSNYNYVEMKELHNGSVLLLFDLDEYDKLDIKSPVYSSTKFGDEYGTMNASSSIVTVRKKLKVELVDDEILSLNNLQDNKILS